MRHLKTAISALVVGLVLLMATDYVAMAATGKTLILGKVNKSKKTTTIKSSKGAALKLVTKSGKPPLVVNEDTLVDNLNADKVDGKSASQLGVRSRVERFDMSGTGVQEVSKTIPNISKGAYLIGYTLWFDRNNNTPGYCFINTSENDYTGYSNVAGRNVGDGDFPTSGFGVLQFENTGALTLLCRFTDAVNVAAFDQVTLAITPIDVQTGSALPRKAPRRTANAPSD